MPTNPAPTLAAQPTALASKSIVAEPSQPDTPLAVPTLAEYLPRVRAAASPGTCRTYWDRMANVWGDRRLNDIAASDIEALHRTCTTTAIIRSNARNGRHAAENLIAAARAVYNRAIADGLIDPRFSLAHRVHKPRRLPSTRRALTPHELTAITDAARTTDNDVILDTLLLRFHTETAARRGGALALRPHRPGYRTLPGAVAREGRHHPLATHQPSTHDHTHRPRRLSRSGTAHRLVAALPRRPPVHQPPLRPPLAPHRPPPALGRHPWDIDALVAPHHTHLGGAPLRIRHRPRLRRTLRLPKMSSVLVRRRGGTR